jgi:hypothetical protein
MSPDSSWFGDDQGRGSLHLHPGRYGVLATTKTTCALLEFDTANLPPLPLRLRLAPAAALLVQNEIGPGFATLTVHAASGMLVHDREVTGTWTTTLRLPAGAYTAAWTNGLGNRTQQHVALGEGGATLRIGP